MLAPKIVGILNATPDSFSNGGVPASLDQGLAMLRAGADILDIGGESTRPGAAPVDPAEEQARILPLIRALAGQGARLSVDTRNAATMRAALDAGACMINDVSALTHDPDAAAIVAAAGCPVILMHMRGTPQTMMRLTEYDDIAAEVRDALAMRADAAQRAGIARRNIILDPGLGFAKTAGQSAALLRALRQITGLGYPVLIGASRKGFIGALSGEADSTRRLGGSLAASLFAAAHGASYLRVHDAAETVQAMRVWTALHQG